MPVPAIPYPAPRDTSRLLANETHIEAFNANGELICKIYEADDYPLMSQTGVVSWINEYGDHTDFYDAKKEVVASVQHDATGRLDAEAAKKAGFIARPAP